MGKWNFRSLWFTNLTAVLTMIIGIGLIIKPDILELICIAAGSLLLLAGLGFAIYGFIRNRSLPFTCIPLAGGGLLLLIVPTLLRFLIPVFFGLWIFLSSASGIHRSYQTRQFNRKWWIGSVLCTIAALVGIFVMSRPVTVMESTVRLVGIALTVFSLLKLISSGFSRRSQTAEMSATDDVIETTMKE